MPCCSFLERYRDQITNKIKPYLLENKSLEEWEILSSLEVEVNKVKVAIETKIQSGEFAPEFYL